MFLLSIGLNMRFDDGCNRQKAKSHEQSNTAPKKVFKIKNVSLEVNHEQTKNGLTLTCVVNIWNKATGLR